MESVCLNCKNAFNLFEKQRIFLNCGDSICLSCFKSYMQPQENKLTCIECGEVSEYSEKFKQILMKMKQNLSGLGIKCDEHPDQNATLFCKAHDAYICSECEAKTHSNHQSQIDKIQPGELDQWSQKSQEQLLKLREKIYSINDQLQSYLARDKEFSSEEFVKMRKETQELLSLQKQSEREKENMALPYQKLFKEQKQDSLIGPKPVVNNPEISSEFLKATIQKLFEFDDHALKVFRIGLIEQELLKKWIGYKVQFSLLYRGTRDGFTSKDFFNRCSGKGPTLTIIKSNYGKIFGAYTSLSFEKSDPEKQHEDKNAFLFSLTERYKLEQTGKRKDYAVRYEKGALICMGYGPAISIMEDCDSKANCSSEIEQGDSTFRLPQMIKNGDYGCRFLVGCIDYRDRFKVLEIDTYRCERIF